MKEKSNKMLKGDTTISKVSNSSNKDGQTNFSKFFRDMNGLMIVLKSLGKCIVFFTINCRLLILKMTGINSNLIISSYTKSI